MTEKLSKGSVAWNSLMPSLENLIKNWQPPKLNKELSYRDSLYDVLKNAIPEDCVIQKEYRHHGTTIDLWLKWRGLLSVTEVGFELKLNLTKKSEFDRLIGQTEGMEPSKTNIVIVLVGQVDDAFLMKLRHRYAEKMESLSKTMVVVHVPVDA